ncbi:CDP-diacylglycerol--glycerol-3-phosphate 3-phosphatidyltransferase [Minicystis rosea]|nr:CDP-diacylglycerol--glycerol-3-phosphate 3-phosphatidyltransferase [Minicystis rosea]
MPILSIAALLLFTAIALSYAVRVMRSGRLKHERLGDSPGSALCPAWVVEAFYWALAAAGRALARLGVSPDTLTWLSLAFSLASVPLLAIGHFPEAALCIAAGGGLDAIDGLVARTQGRASPAGAILDAVIDRLSDAAPFVGLSLYYRDRLGTLAVPLAALVASSLVSYVRARTDGLGLVLPNGLMRRHERVSYLVLALLLGPLVPPLAIAPGIPCPATLAGTAFIAIASAIAAILLVTRARAALSETAPQSAEAPRRPALRAFRSLPRDT